MQGNEPPMQNAGLLPTRGETSFLFYAYVIAVLVCLIVVYWFWGGHAPYRWRMIAASAVVGGAALINSIRLASMSVILNDRGLSFRRLWERTELAWTDVEFVRFATLHERFGSYGGLIVVEGNQRRFHFIVAPDSFSQTKSQIAALAPHAVIVDRDTGTIRAPHGRVADAQIVRMREAQRSFVISRALRNGGQILIVALVGGLILLKSPSGLQFYLAEGACVLIIASLATDAYRIKKRFWRSNSTP